MVQFCLTNSIFTKSLTSWSSNFIESTGGSFQTFSIKSLLTWWWEVGEAWWQFTKTCQVQTITGWWFPEENTLVKTLGLYNANRHPALRIAHVLNAHFWNIEDQTVITVIKANKKHSYLTWDLTRYSKGMFTYIYIYKSLTNSQSMALLVSGLQVQFYIFACMWIWPGSLFAIQGEISLKCMSWCYRWSHCHLLSHTHL